MLSSINLILVGRKEIFQLEITVLLVRRTRPPKKTIGRINRGRNSEIEVALKSFGYCDIVVCYMM